SSPVYLDGPPAGCMSGCGTCGSCPTCPTCPSCPTCPPQPYMQPMMQQPTMQMQCQPQTVPCQPMVPVVQQQCVQPQPVLSRWSIWGDALYIRPTGVDMAYAQQQNGIGGAGTVPFGNIGVDQPDFNIGFRVGAECRFNCNESVFVSYER